MQINLTARSDDITQPMKDYALKKADKLDKYFGRVNSIEVVLDSEKERWNAEIIVSAPQKNRLVASEETDDIYAAIDQVVDKMERQLKKVSGKLKQHHSEAKVIAMQAPLPDDEEEEEETYQDVVDKTDFTKKEKEK